MPVKKVCSCCGAVFQCRHDNILLCHCATVKLDSLQRAYIKEHFPDCLCHDCLKKIQEGELACKANLSCTDGVGEVTDRLSGDM
ncbi:cysteine-rich CWC family protein [Bacteroides fragilis]|uniref:cysteine-rich CWC family protein n=1 Tax=Bacteroides fragilis TaxID=817 RepID=UPI0039B61257